MKKINLSVVITKFCMLLALLGIGVVPVIASYRNTYIYYFIYAVVLCVLYKGCFVVDQSFASMIPITFLGLYFYGVIVGLINSNDVRMIAANFTGMLIYFVYFFLKSSKIEIKYFEKLLVLLSVMICIATIIAYIDCFVLWTGYVRRIPVLKNFQEAYSIQYFSKELIYCSYLYGLYQLLFNRVFKWRYLLIIILDWVAILFCIKLSGPLLAMLALTGIFLWSLSGRRFGASGQVIFILFCIFILLIKFDLVNRYIFSIFSAEDEGNAIRYRQINYFLQSLNFLGHGLGADLQMNRAGYGVEMIYLNIVHKFGVLSIIYFGGLLYTFYQAYKILRNTEGNPYDVIPLGCMGYCFTALGNPVLFAPPHVLLHCIALLIISKKGKRLDYNRGHI